ncbi:MAG TPA: MFS transporter [Gaiellaceae bacterium]|nr:MFS transporter [Gaiellaceae bacterium]
MTGPRAAFALLRQRDFGPYFVGNAVSSSGTWFQNLAAALLVYRLTHSALLLGVLNFAQFAAVIVLAPWAGAAADKLDRRKLLIATQVFATVLTGALAALTFAGLVGVPTVIVFSLGLGVGSAFSSPVQQAYVTSIVEPHELRSALALNSMTFNLARAIGPALAAVVVAQLGIAAAFALNSASYVVLAAAVARSRPRRHRRLAPGKVRLLDSIRLVRANPRLLALLIVTAAVGFASDPVNTLAPAFAHAFGYRDVVGGYIIGAFGFGAVMAAFALAGREFSRKNLIATLCLMAAGVAGFAVSPWLELGMPILVLGGIGYLASNTTANARLQLEVEDHERGRIMALWSIAFIGLRPFASLLDGGIASAASVRVAGVVLVLPALAAAGLLAVRERRGR